MQCPVRRYVPAQAITDQSVIDNRCQVAEEIAGETCGDDALCCIHGFCGDEVGPLSLTCKAKHRTNNTTLDGTNQVSARSHLRLMRSSFCRGHHTERMGGGKHDRDASLLAAATRFSQKERKLELRVLWLGAHFVSHQTIHRQSRKPLFPTVRYLPDMRLPLLKSLCSPLALTIPQSTAPHTSTIRTAQMVTMYKF